MGRHRAAWYGTKRLDRYLFCSKRVMTHAYSVSLRTDVQ